MLQNERTPAHPTEEIKASEGRCTMHREWPCQGSNLMRSASPGGKASQRKAKEALRIARGPWAALQSPRCRVS